MARPIRRGAVSPPAGGPILVTGATGNQGGAVVRALVNRGHAVRAFVRDADAAPARALAAAGRELAVGDLTDRDAVERAMTGAASAFALTTPGEDPSSEVRQGLAIVAAAQRAGLPHLVLASVASAGAAPEIPHFASKARIEQAATASGVPTTVVAPTWFFENLLGRRDDILAGTLPIALPPDRAIQAVALTDLGHLVATVIEAGPALAGRRIEVAGDELTPIAMARTLTAVTGAPVRAREIPVAQLERRSHDLAAMYRFLAHTGYHVDISALHHTFPEVVWHSFSDWTLTVEWGG